MAKFWTHRPSLPHLGQFFAIYILACGYAEALAVAPGPAISIWPPSGVFIAALVLAPRPTWPWWVLVGLLAELLGNQLWFGNPLPVALLIYAGNALAAVAGAWLVNRALGRPVRIDTLQDVLIFLIIGAGIAPIASATAGSAALQWLGGAQSPSFADAWARWWIADATGVLLLAPLAPALHICKRSLQISTAQWLEAAAVGVIVLGLAALSLNGHLPFAYVVVPPVFWGAVRFEFNGALVGLILLALVMAYFTIVGDTGFVGQPENLQHQQILQQLFLGVSAFSALVVAALSRQHRTALLTLRQSERELSQFVDIMPSYLWRMTPDGEPVFFSRRMIDLLGLNVGDYEKPGTPGFRAAIAQAVHPDDAAGAAEALSHSLVTGQSFFRRHRVRRADGTYRWMDSRAEPLRDEDGRIVWWCGLFHDVEDQVQAEAVLRASEQQLRRLVDALPTQIWAATAEGEPSYINRRLADYVGLTVDDLDMPEANRLQVAIQASVHPDDAPSVASALARSFRTGEAFMMKYRQQRADGAYCWINGRAEPLRDPDGRIIQWYGVNFDIDEDVRTQEELRRTQERLAVASQAASLAELSASIAHEVNQPLAAIVANSHACHRWLAATPPNLERAKVTAERIIRDANSAADVVGRIRALFKQSTELRSLTTLADIVTEVGDLLTEQASRRGVRLDVEVESGLPLVALDRIQVQQVLINIMRNGIEAMESAAGQRVLRIRVRRVSEVLRTEISDCGPGLQFPERIFEPFFTTKGSGMGMGLAISRSIVESHGGRLWAENAEPHGARFIFTLPVEVKTPS